MTMQLRSENTGGNGFLIKLMLLAAAAVVSGGASTGCTRDVQAMTPQSIEQQYGVPGAYTETVSTTDGSLAGTIVPATLADGRIVQLFIPASRAKDTRAVYMRDGDGLHPLHVKAQTTREEIARAPAVVAAPAPPPHANKRSWEKEAVIIGGGAGAGTAIGAIAGGKKGAGIGAAAGGVGGLLYDLITRDKQ
jgi:hypothetical protein